MNYSSKYIIQLHETDAICGRRVDGMLDKIIKSIIGKNVGSALPSESTGPWSLEEAGMGAGMRLGSNRQDGLKIKCSPMIEHGFYEYSQ